MYQEMKKFAVKFWLQFLPVATMLSLIMRSSMHNKIRQLVIKLQHRNALNFTH